MQRKIAKRVLYNEIRKFKYFFHDYQNEMYAPEDFMLRVLTSLDSELFRPYDIICKRQANVDSLIMLAQGTADLFGYCKVRDIELKVHITKLPEQSWYGDFQILLEEQATFQLEAGKIEARRDLKSG